MGFIDLFLCTAILEGNNYRICPDVDRLEAAGCANRMDQPENYHRHRDGQRARVLPEIIQINVPYFHGSRSVQKRGFLGIPFL